MAARKTFSVDTFRSTCNSLFANMDGDTEMERQYRQGVITALENVLHESGNYRGFCYLRKGDFSGKGRPGVIYAEVPGGLGVQVPHPDYEVRFNKATTDDTRVHYH